MDTRIDKLFSALEELNGMFEHIYASGHDTDPTKDHVLDFVEREYKWSTPQEFEKLLEETQNLFDWNYDIGETEDESAIVLEDTYKEFSYLLTEIYKDTNCGYFDNLPNSVHSITTLLEESQVLNDKLNEFDIYGEEIISLLLTITSSINLNENYSYAPEILPKNLKELTEEIIYQISRNPELLHSIEPRLFEELISKIVQKFRIKTELTKQTRDGGYDIIAIDDSAFTKNKYLIECKRFKPNHKVDVSIVQRLYGIKMSEQVTKALLITSSTFTKDAFEFAKQHCWELELYDYNDITKWLNAYWK